MITVQCPKCDRSLELEDGFEERYVFCAGCGAEFPFTGQPGIQEAISLDTPDSRLDLDGSARPLVLQPTTGPASPASPAPPDRSSDQPSATQPAPRPVTPAPATARPLVLAITGASGAPYAVRLLRVLAQSGRDVHLVMSLAGAQVLRDELGIVVDPDHFDAHAFLNSVLGDSTPADLETQRSTLDAQRFLRYQHYMDWSAGIASGSFLTDGMVVCPCSMSTLAAIAGGLSTNLIQRAADVHLKERRKLILVPRETPLNLIQLENMTQCVRAGAIVLPAMPGWYHRPRSLDDIVNFVVGRICDQLGVPHGLVRRWGDANRSKGST